MKTLQFREAICEAMSEEMRRDETIYLMGEEVAEYNGAYKASKGMLDEFGAKRVIDVATLTGAMVMALGKEYTGAFKNDEKFLKELKKASKKIMIFLMMI